MSEEVLKEIDEIVKNNDVVLFMKGTADFPQCGFSGAVVNILNQLGIKFKDINVLERLDIRDGVKQYADWPTIPQLYIKGEFIGGCDIAKELFASGELANLLQSV